MSIKWTNSALFGSKMNIHALNMPLIVWKWEEECLHFMEVTSWHHHLWVNLSTLKFSHSRNFLHKCRSQNNTPTTTTTSRCQWQIIALCVLACNTYWQTTILNHHHARASKQTRLLIIIFAFYAPIFLLLFFIIDSRTIDFVRNCFKDHPPTLGFMRRWTFTCHCSIYVNRQPIK